MKVNTKFTFGEDELRAIRASIGRKGKATRLEVRVFVDRAVRQAIEDAPEVKQIRRVKKEAPAPDPRATETEIEERARDRANHAKIAKHYGHAAGEVARG